MKPELVQKYVENGTLRIEWRDFPALGQESVNAALAGRAAQAQGKFWEYHDLLFNNQSDGFGDEQLLTHARDLGLDVEKFEQDLKGSEYDDEVVQDFEEGQEAGVSGTPAFDINGQLVVGAQPVETFEQIIERAKREAEGG